MIQKFHNMGINIVILKGLHLGDDLFLYVLASNKEKVYKMSFKKIEGYFSGTGILSIKKGDLIAALILATTTMYPNDFKTAIEKAFSVLQAVIKNTPINQELHLIQSRDIIRKMEITFTAEEIKI